jgi:hypothetical protein
MMWAYARFSQLVGRRPAPPVISTGAQTYFFIAGQY